MVEELVSTRTFVLGMIHDDGRLIADELYGAGESKSAGITNGELFRKRRRTYNDCKF